jgi:transposase
MSKSKNMFVGIDTSKNSHQVSFLNPTKVKKDLRIENNREGFDELTDRLETYRAEGYQLKVACEPTGHYWENLGRHLIEEGFKVKIVNPLHTNRYKEIMDNTPQKDDRKDSRIIAQLAREDKTLHQNLPKEPYAELRGLTHLREDLLEDRSRLRNKLHKWLDRHFPEYPKLFSNLLGATCLGLLEEYRGPDDLKEAPFKELTEKIYSLSRGKLGLKLAKKVKTQAAETIGKTIAPNAARARLDHLLSRISSLLKEINQVKDAIQKQLNSLEESEYLLSIPGVGWWGASVFLGEAGDPTRLPRARSVVKLAGLNLYRTQSGKSKSGLSITKRGRSLLRKAAYQMALAGVECNQEFKNFYECKIERGKAKVSALVALSAKVLRVMYGVVKNEENYLPLEERQNNRA